MEYVIGLAPDEQHLTGIVNDNISVNIEHPTESSIAFSMLMYDHFYSQIKKGICLC